VFRSRRNPNANLVLWPRIFRIRPGVSPPTAPELPPDPDQRPSALHENVAAAQSEEVSLSALLVVFVLLVAYVLVLS
jgi:hypothetical protein